MSVWLAADQLPASDDNTALLLGILGLLGVALTAAGAVAVALINTRGKANAAAEPVGGMPMGERVAANTVRLDQVERRLEEGEDGNEMQDRQINRIGYIVDQMKPIPDVVAAIVRYLDRDHQGWR